MMNGANTRQGRTESYLKGGEITVDRLPEPEVSSSRPVGLGQDRLIWEIPDVQSGMEVTEMRQIPNDVRPLLFGRGARWHAWVAMALNWLGLGCLVVGVVGDAANRIPGLEPNNWFIMAAALWVWALAAWITAYAASKEG